MQIQHRDFTLIGHTFSESSRLNTCYAVNAFTGKGGSEINFTEVVTYSHHFVHFYQDKNVDPISGLQKRVFDRAKARIDLGIYESGQTYREDVLTTTPQPEPKPDEAIQRYILNALHRLRRKYAADYRYESLEIDGFCELLGIEKNQYIYNAEILSDRGYVTNVLNGDNLKNGGIHITVQGIDYLEQMQKAGTTGIQRKKEIREQQAFEFDLVISYAGEDSKVADEIANSLKGRGFSVFYDRFEDMKVKLWGTNLYDHLANIYSRKGRYCLILISKDYAKKVWTNHERQHAQARALEEAREYILPVKLDETVLEGMASTISYLDIKSTPLEKIIAITEAKLST